MPGSKKNVGNGKWQLTVSNGFDINGKPIRHYKTVEAKSERAADKLLAEFYVSIKKMPVMKRGKITFSGFYEIWKTRYESSYSETTRHSNEHDVKNRILPYFGKLYLNQINADHISNFLLEMKQHKMRLDGRNGLLSDATIHKYFRILRAILNKAVELEYISFNPCSKLPRAEKPKPNYKKRPIYQERELSEFFKAIDNLKENALNTKYKLMVYLGFFGGIRRGELYGLKWCDWDENNMTLNIRHSCYDVGKGAKGLKKPKTKSSDRIIYYNEEIKVLFSKHKKYQDEWLKKYNIENDEQYVFIAGKGVIKSGKAKLASPSGFYSWLMNFIKKHKFKHITVHSLRHMAASYALANGAALTSVQSMMGHTRIETTAIYLHELENKTKETSNILTDIAEHLRKQGDDC